ncbi:MAG: hypothetical protein ACC707_00695, partial [Thiohalomonadales bacterium]
MVVMQTANSDRVITLEPGLAALPERLLLAHARGEVLFIAGAGISIPANLPDFRGLVLKIYKKLDLKVYSVISSIPRQTCNKWAVNLSSLIDQQSAEVNRFIGGEYDVMRDLLISTPGRSGLISKHRMIESLSYFLNADSEWTKEKLVLPLNADSDESLALWRAISRRTHFLNVLKIIGVKMTERAIDKRLGRETRRSLVFSLVVECLHSFREDRNPAVPLRDITQMLRLLEDEVRVFGAKAIQIFVRDVSAPSENGHNEQTPEESF